MRPQSVLGSLLPLPNRLQKLPVLLGVGDDLSLWQTRQPLALQGRPALAAELAKSNVREQKRIPHR
jgi:hypothetical protein